MSMGNSPSAAADFFSLFETLAGALNKADDRERLYAALPPGVPKKKPLDLPGLMNAMACLGHVGSPVSLRFCDIDPRLLPCLLVPENQEKEPFILTEKSEELQKGTAWFFVEEKDHRDSLSGEVRKASGFTWFRGLLERFRGLFFQILTIGAILTVVSLAVPLFVMTVYDRVIGAHAPETLAPLLMGVIMALGIEGILRFLRSRVLAWFGARLNYIVSTHIFERLMLMPPVFTERASVAAQIARIKAFEAVRDFFTGSLFLALVEFPFTLIILAVIAMIAGPLAFIPLVMAALYAVLVMVMRPHIRAAVRLSGRAAAARQEAIIETFEKTDALRTGGLTSAWFRQFRDLSGKASLSGFHASWLSSIVETISQILYTIAGLSVLVFGIERIWNGDMSAGALVATMILVWRVLAPIQIFCNALPRYEQLRNAITQINHLMRIETEKKEGAEQAKAPDFRGRIVFFKVGLRYTKEQDPVFTGLSFEAQPGNLIAITGGNGSGKSTILKLANGLYSPQAGSILIDDIDIRQFDPQNLRRHIAYVPQSLSLYKGTIAENLRFAAPLADDKDIEKALRGAGIWEEINALPEGINTPISNGNIKNMAYNLNLARAYVKDASIILLDELPYVFLNSPAGELFRETLKGWKGQKTVLMVTHREDYLKLADKVVFLNAGQSPIVGYPEQIIENIYENYSKKKYG